MAESDDMREEMRNAITVALTLASVAQRGVVHARERARDDAQARLHATQAEAEAVAALERARQTADPGNQAHAYAEAPDSHQFAELNDPAWWDNASAEEIAGKWTDVQQASDNQDPDLAAAAEQAGSTMSGQLRERYDIDPSQVDATVDQQLGAYQQDRSLGADPAADGLLADRTQDLGEATPVSPKDRRAQLRDRDAPEDAIDSALAVEDAFPHRTDEVHHDGRQREAGAEQSAGQAARRTAAPRRG